MQPSWEHFEHDADIGIRSFASSPEQAFEQIAVAMTAVITDPELVSTSEVIDIYCQAPELELLLVDWINELIYQMTVRGMLFSRYQVSINHGVLKGKAYGETVDRQKHHPAVEIKGATFTELRVYQRSANSWVAQCVVDV